MYCKKFPDGVTTVMNRIYVNKNCRWCGVITKFLTEAMPLSGFFFHCENRTPWELFNEPRPMWWNSPRSMESFLVFYAALHQWNPLCCLTYVVGQTWYMPFWKGFLEERNLCFGSFITGVYSVSYIRGIGRVSVEKACLVHCKGKVFTVLYLLTL